MVRKGIASLAVLLPVGALASSGSLPPPPESWTAGSHVITQAEGYVVGVFYFTPAQVEDARWEFRRIQAAQWNMCGDERQQFIHREVVWFETSPASGERCARVVYTILCTPYDQFPLPDEAAMVEAFRENRDAVLNEPPRAPIEPGCGEKDRAKLPPPPRIDPPQPPPLIEVLR